MQDKFVTAAIPLDKAKLCPDCNEVFDSGVFALCPHCGLNEGVYLEHWLNPIRREAALKGGTLN